MEPNSDDGMTLSSFKQEEEDASTGTATRQPPNPNRLSFVSSKYDVGQKGYLTTVEKSLRGMDESNRGYLTNEQVAGIKEETQALRDANKLLKKWVVGMALAVVILGISNICVSIIATRLAKDSSIDTSSGLMTVKDHQDVAVMTVGTSHRYNFVFRGTSPLDRCVPLQQVVDMFAQTMSGTQMTAVIMEGQLQDGDDSSAFSTTPMVRALKPNADTSFLNQTHVCFGSTDPSGAGPVLSCIDLTDHQCDNIQNGGRRHLLSEQDHQELTVAKSSFMHRRLARHLQFTTPPANSPCTLFPDYCKSSGNKGQRGSGGYQDFMFVRFPK